MHDNWTFTYGMYGLTYIQDWDIYLVLDLLQFQLQDLFKCFKWLSVKPLYCWRLLFLPYLKTTNNAKNALLVRFPIRIIQKKLRFSKLQNIFPYLLICLTHKMAANKNLRQQYHGVTLFLTFFCGNTLAKTHCSKLHVPNINMFCDWLTKT